MHPRIDMKTQPPTILCPLRMEASKVRPMAARHGWDVITTGIGATAVESAIASAPGTGPLVLAGVAGALRAEFRAGGAHLVREVVTSTGLLYSPLLDDGIRVTGADEIVATPEDKAALAEQTGAHIVDMESHAFAVLAESTGRGWMIVRGISDGVEHHLPPGCDKWFTSSGAIRPARAALDLARRPVDLVHLIAFAKRTATAMRAVAALLDETFSQ